MFVLVSYVIPLVATNSFSANHLPDAFLVHTNHFHGTISLYLPKHAITIHLGKHEACIVRKIHCPLLYRLHGCRAAAKNTYQISNKNHGYCMLIQTECYFGRTIWFLTCLEHGILGIRVTLRGFSFPTLPSPLNGLALSRRLLWFILKCVKNCSQFLRA